MLDSENVEADRKYGKGEDYLDVLELLKQMNLGYEIINMYRDKQN